MQNEILFLCVLHVVKSKIKMPAGLLDSKGSVLAYVMAPWILWLTKDESYPSRHGGAEVVNFLH